MSNNKCYLAIDIDTNEFFVGKKTQIGYTEKRYLKNAIHFQKKNLPGIYRYNIYELDTYGPGSLKLVEENFIAGRSDA